MSLRAYIMVKADTGVFPPEATESPHKEGNRSELIRVDYQMFRQRDVKRGTYTGERIHRPVKILKEIGAITPLIHHAVTHNQEIPEVQLVFIRAKKKSGFEHYMTIKLEEAHFLGQKIYTGSPDMDSESTSRSVSQTDTMELEEVEIGFRRITITNVVDGQESVDDWDKPVVA